jgi:hypothetical protein
MLDSIIDSGFTPTEAVRQSIGQSTYLARIPFFATRCGHLIAAFHVKRESGSTGFQTETGGDSGCCT